MTDSKIIVAAPKMAKSSIQAKVDPRQENAKEKELSPVVKLGRSPLNPIGRSTIIQRSSHAALLRTTASDESGGPLALQKQQSSEIEDLKKFLVNEVSPKQSSPLLLQNSPTNAKKASPGRSPKPRISEFEKQSQRYQKNISSSLRVDAPPLAKHLTSIEKVIPKKNLLAQKQVALNGGVPADELKPKKSNTIVSPTKTSSPTAASKIHLKASATSQPKQVKLGTQSVAELSKIEQPTLQTLPSIEKDLERKGPSALTLKRLAQPKTQVHSALNTRSDRNSDMHYTYDGLPRRNPNRAKSSIESINSLVDRLYKKPDPSVREEVLSRKQEFDPWNTRHLKSQSNLGPGTYNLPEIFGTQGAASVSSIRKVPEISFGLRPKKKSYYHECYKDFQGSDSPGTGHYSPDSHKVLKKNPGYSLGKFQRFHKPDSLVKIQNQVPCQYATLDFSEKPQGQADLMGLGKKFDITPKDLVPGASNFIHPKSILSGVIKARESGSKLGFGASRDQYDKLQYSGQQKHYYGREGQGPAAYQTVHTIPIRSRQSIRLKSLQS